LKSKDQLWIIKSAPNGSRAFVKARVVQSILFITPAALISSVAIAVIAGFTGIEFLALFLVPVAAGMGGALIGVGVTASNPTYEDANSAVLKANMSKSMMITILSFMLYTIVDFGLGTTFDLGGIFQQIYQIPSLYILLMVGPLPVVGLITAIWGMRKFSQIE